MPKNNNTTTSEYTNVEGYIYYTDKIEGPYRQDLNVLKRYKEYTSFNSESKKNIMYQLDVYYF